jgi:hypothetical protein
MHLRIYLETTSKRTGRTRIVPNSTRELEVDDTHGRTMTPAKRKGLAATSGLTRPAHLYPAWRER